MKRFTFTLQTLLNVKQTLEKQQKAELSEINARLLQLESELEDIHARMEKTRVEYLSRLAEGGLSVKELNGYNSGFRAYRNNIEAQKKKIRAVEEERRRARKKLTDTMNERKVLEKLKEKQYAEYTDELRREDAKIIDDFMSNKATNK